MTPIYPAYKTRQSYTPPSHTKERAKEKDKTEEKDSASHSEESSVTNHIPTKTAFLNEIQRSGQINIIGNSLESFHTALKPPLLHDIDKAINYFSTPSWNQIIDVQF